MSNSPGFWLGPPVPAGTVPMTTPALERGVTAALSPFVAQDMWLGNSGFTVYARTVPMRAYVYHAQVRRDKLAAMRMLVVYRKRLRAMGFTVHYEFHPSDAPRLVVTGWPAEANVAPTVAFVGRRLA